MVENSSKTEFLNSENEKYTHEYLEENIKVLDGNEIYRVTDILKCHSEDVVRPTFIIRLLSDPQFEGTIMRQYVERTNKGPFDFNILSDILLEHKHRIEPYDDKYVLVHVRTGDDIKDRGLENELNRKIYLKEINRIPKDKIIVLVTTMHYGHAEIGSIYGASTWVYSKENKNKNIQLLHNFIKEIPHKVEIQSSTETDIDFMHLVFANKIIALNTSGGFSMMAKMLNESISSFVP